MPNTSKFWNKDRRKQTSRIPGVASLTRISDITLGGSNIAVLRMFAQSGEQSQSLMTMLMLYLGCRVEWVGPSGLTFMATIHYSFGFGDRYENITQSDTQHKNCRRRIDTSIVGRT